MSAGNHSIFNFLKLKFIFDSEIKAYGAEFYTVTTMRDWFANKMLIPRQILNYQNFKLGPLPPWNGSYTTISILDFPKLLPLLAYRAVVRMRDDRSNITIHDRVKLAQIIFNQYPYLRKWHELVYGQPPEMIGLCF